MTVFGNRSDFSGASDGATETGQPEIRLQVAALCFRVNRGKAEILLITSRDTGRWLLPKGWPVDGLDAPESAAREAWEEAGVKGETHEICLGHYAYLKTMPGTAGLPCRVAVYPLRVETIKDRFRERRQRQRKWFALVKAATLVQEPGAQLLIAAFADNPLLQAGSGGIKA